MPTEPEPDSDFIKHEGLSFFAHLLRRVSDRLVDGFEDWYREAGIAAPVRTASTLRVLYRKGPLPVTTIAKEICQSHPLVITWIRQLKALEMVRSRSHPDDARMSIIELTELGRETARQMIQADEPIEKAYRTLFAETDGDCFAALWRIEEACREKGMAERLREAELD